MEQAGWISSTLGEQCELYQPKTISIKNLKSDGKYPVYGANGQIGMYDQFNHVESEVLLSCRGNCGTVNVSKPNAWINGNAMVCKPKTELLIKDYLALYLQSVDWAPVITGTAQPQITRQPLAAVRIVVPPVDEQRRIVATLEDRLSRLDKALAEVNHVSQLLKVQRSSLVHNLIARLKAENTPLKPLSEVLDMQTGPAFQSKNFTDASQGIRLLRGENIEPGALRWNNTKSWRHDKLEGFEKYFVQENDLILAMDRPVVSAGLKLAVVKKGDLPCLLVQRVARMRANGKALADYVYPFLLSLDFESHLAIDSTGTQIPHISMKGIGSFEIPVPSHERQLELALEMTEAAQSLETARQTTEKARLQISTLRRSILSSAFAGEL